MKKSTAAARDPASKAWKIARALPVALMVLSACSTSPQGRPQITAPAPVSNLYSEADMRIHLVTVPSINTPCVGVECEMNRKFDQQVQQLGARIAVAAFDVYPDLGKRIDHFKFVVEEKANFGSTSSGGGKVVIFRGIQKLELDDAALAFLIAREMGHVIGQHHAENSATRILFSVAVGMLFPALHLFSGTTAAAQATTASSTTMATAAASTATSYIGSKVVLDSIKPGQLGEADAIALNLLENMGWSQHEIVTALETAAHTSGNNTWEEDLRLSISQLRKLDEEAQAAAYNLAAESAALTVTMGDAQHDAATDEVLAEAGPIDKTTEGGEPVGTAAMEPERIEPVILAEATTGIIAVVEADSGVAGGWEPAKPGRATAAGASARPPKQSRLPVSKAKQPVRHKVSVKGTGMKAAARTASGKRAPALRLAGSLSKKSVAQYSAQHSKYQAKAKPPTPKRLTTSRAGPGTPVPAKKRHRARP